MNDTKDNDDMASMPEHESSVILNRNIEEHIRRMAGSTTVVTGYVVLISTADMNHPASVTGYYEAYKGPMHQLLGLNSMQRRMIERQDDEDHDAGDL